MAELKRNQPVPFNLVRVAPAQPVEPKEHIPLGQVAYNATKSLAQTVKSTGLGFVDGWRSI